MRGERLTKDKETERMYSGLFVLIPFYIGSVVWMFSTLKNSFFIIWLTATVSLTALYFISDFWGKFIPVKVSYTLGVIVWIVSFWIASQIDLAKF
jgi:hypothetical protein